MELRKSFSRKGLRRKRFSVNVDNMPQISDELVEQLAAVATAIHAFVAAVSGPADRLSDDIAAQVNSRVSRGVCLQCETELAKENRVSRGLCGTCYARSIQRIKRGKVTEMWLIANGFILSEVSKGGRKSTRPDPVGAMLSSRDASAAEVESEAQDGIKIARGESPLSKKTPAKKRR